MSRRKDEIWPCENYVSQLRWFIGQALWSKYETERHICGNNVAKTRKIFSNCANDLTRPQPGHGKTVLCTWSNCGNEGRKQSHVIAALRVKHFYIDCDHARLKALSSGKQFRTWLEIAHPPQVCDIQINPWNLPLK